MKHHPGVTECQHESLVNTHIMRQRTNLTQSQRYLFGRLFEWIVIIHGKINQNNQWKPHREKKKNRKNGEGYTVHAHQICECVIQGNTTISASQ